MARSLLLSLAVLVPALGIGGVLGLSTMSPAQKPAVAARVSLGPHAMHLEPDVRALPTQDIKEPF